MSPVTPTSHRIIASGERVWAPAAGVSHHHATHHDGSGCDNDYRCDVCQFTVEDGVVVIGGEVLKEESQ